MRGSLYVIICALVALMLSGCATAPTNYADVSHLWRDDLFPGYQAQEIESAESIFYLDTKAKQFVDAAVRETSSGSDNLRRLIHQIFNDDELGIRYMTDANTIASETFAKQEANCLSLTIMAYAMMEYGGFAPVFYEVSIPEFWVRRGGMNVLNGHVNLEVALAPLPQQITNPPRSLTVDFDSESVRDYASRKPISRQQVLAMFYNNKGADALIANQDVLAYAYFRQALAQDRANGSAWVNLGVLYRRQQAMDAAKDAYEFAIALNGDHLIAWENLALLYEAEGLRDKARSISATVTSKRQSNPFYHFILGEEALELGKAEEALSHYRQAWSLDRTRHEFLFGLGKAYYELGKIDQATRYIKLAIRYAPDHHDEGRYSAKLSGLQSAR